MYTAANAMRDVVVVEPHVMECGESAPAKVLQGVQEDSRIKKKEDAVGLDVKDIEAATAADLMEQAASRVRAAADAYAEAEETNQPAALAECRQERIAAARGYRTLQALMQQRLPL